MKLNGSFSWLYRNRNIKSLYLPLKNSRKSPEQNLRLTVLAICYKYSRKLTGFLKLYFFFSLPQSTPISLTLIIYTRRKLSCKELFPACKRLQWELFSRWAHRLICPYNWISNRGSVSLISAYGTGTFTKMTYSHLWVNILYKINQSVIFGFLEHHTFSFLISIFLKAL